MDQNLFHLAQPGTPGSAPPTHQDVVVIGCGNLLRADDGVGPILIRELWEAGLGDVVTLVDGGTAGMDVAFKMAGAKEVILIDASNTGAPPGTIYRVPGGELENLPPLQGFTSHSFRWDHALAFAHWLLGDGYPPSIKVYLIEAGETCPGGPMSEAVVKSKEIVKGMIEEVLLFRDPSVANRS